MPQQHCQERPVFLRSEDAIIGSAAIGCAAETVASGPVDACGSMMPRSHRKLLVQDVGASQADQSFAACLAWQGVLWMVGELFCKCLRTFRIQS